MDNSNIIETIKETNRLYPDSVFNIKNKTYSFVNPIQYLKVRKNWNVYGQLDGLFVDGILVCKLIKLFWGYNITRVSFDMTSMAKELFNKLNQNNASIFFIGTKQEKISQSIKIIRSSYPEMNIIGFRNGYFKDEEERNSTIKSIISQNPDYVIVGMGGFIQEKFALDLKKNGYNGIVFTCGGFLHQTANGIKYYPEWVDKYNLRAIYRRFKEPGLIMRLIKALTIFPIIFAYDSLQSRLFHN